MTAETCPHYLTFTSDDVPEGGTRFKCAPPVRSAADRDALWDGLARGTCAFVVTDHSPAPPALKCIESGDFIHAWGGIASLELSLAAVWTGASARGFDLGSLARWMSEEPARFSGLPGRKGAIRPGCDADLVVWDPEARYEVKASRLQQRHKLTPYDERILRGLWHATYIRGERVWIEGQLVRQGPERML